MYELGLLFRGNLLTLHAHQWCKTTRIEITVNERMQTSIPNICAAGDVVGIQLLVNAAIKEVKVAASNLTGGDEEMSHDVIPRCVFVTPEVASVGLIETQHEIRD